MGKYLNIGLDGFASLRNGNYIDKSMLISYIIDNLNTPDNLICVSRPRRFGKSSAIKMIAAYFDYTVNSHSLFDALPLMLSPWPAMFHCVGLYRLYPEHRSQL